MEPHTLSRNEARRIAVRAAHLDIDRPGTVSDMVRGIAMVRVELTATVVAAADHVAWSRIGSDYRPADTTRALASGILFERGWMLRPIADLGLYLAGMRTWADRSNTRGWMDANADFARGILAAGRQNAGKSMRHKSSLRTNARGLSVSAAHAINR